MKKLISWFESNKRLLPWRINKTPYAVWVSEVMLQQTRAEVVIGYFDRWMQTYPTIYDLAAATEEQVIKSWEGLGYYSRARNLRNGARKIVTEDGGCFPDSLEALRAVPGIGPYTAGAILSFAFEKRAVAIDGNVLRVLSRYWCQEEEIDKSSTRSLFAKRLEVELPQAKPWVAMEGLIELGALICKPKPLCHLCPLKKSCQAYQQGRTLDLPNKKKRKKIEKIDRSVACIEHQGKILMRKVPEGQVMAGLYELPYIEGRVQCSGKIGELVGMQLKGKGEYPSVQHGFTHYQVTLYPVVYEVLAGQAHPSFEWLAKEDLAEMSCPSGHREIVARMLAKKREGL